MADSDVVAAAFGRAWSVYLLINKGISEHDEKRSFLERFIRERRKSGVEDTEMLAVAGLKYLKGLDQSGPESHE